MSHSIEWWDTEYNPFVKLYGCLNYRSAGQSDTYYWPKSQLALNWQHKEDTQTHTIWSKALWVISNESMSWADLHLKPLPTNHCMAKAFQLQFSFNSVEYFNFIVITLQYTLLLTTRWDTVKWSTPRFAENSIKSSLRELDLKCSCGSIYKAKNTKDRTKLVYALINFFWLQRKAAFYSVFHHDCEFRFHCHRKIGTKKEITCKLYKNDTHCWVHEWNEWILC